ncbi:MAG: hypothetical protein ACXAEL_02730 [Candidatus Hodarchaeales archaeon]
MITAASIVRMDTIEGPQIEYSWTANRKTQDVFSKRGLVQLYTISTMNTSSIPRMIQYDKGTCLISLRNSSEEGTILLALLLNKDTSQEAQSVLWKKVRMLHGRLKTVEKLTRALDKLVNDQQAN